MADSRTVPRKGMPSPRLSRADFRVRFLERFRDPAFEPLAAELDRYIGYGEPYATSHDALDRDLDIQAEARIAALTLWDAVKARRAGEPNLGSRRESPRQK